MKAIFLKVLFCITICSGVNAQLINNAFSLNNDYGDLYMRRYISGDTNWKRALVSGTNELIINYGGDFSEGTRIMGSNLTLDGSLTLSSKINLYSDNNEGITIGRFNDQLGWDGSGEQPGYHIRFTGYRDVAPNIIGARISALRTNRCCSGKAQGMELTFSVVETAITGVVGDANLKEALRIKSNGNIGIGTENPDAKLAVNGTIHTKEVNVDLNGWSDFVFDDNYELRTLEEVEKHITENGHLPEIPSESEVIENGINLGEMDAKLLQKIEELTLYMIDMNKRMHELETENQELKEEVNHLENK